MVYDGFTQPFGSDTVEMTEQDRKALKFATVLPPALGAPTISARAASTDIVAFIFEASTRGTFKITETPSDLTQADLERSLVAHPPSVSVKSLPLSGGDAIVEYNAGYIEVTIIVDRTLVKIFGPTAGFSQQQAAQLADEFARARAGSS